MRKTQTTIMQTEVPALLMTQAQQLVDAGWFRSLDELCAVALRRFLDSRGEDLMANFILHDVEWGLAGND